MESSIFKKAGEFLAAKSKRRYWQMAVAALGIVVIVSTAYVLSKPAQTLVKETYCGMEEHEHTEECYELTLICELGEEDAASDGSAEGETPETVPTPVPAEPSAEEKQPEYIEERVLTCGQEVSHVHTLNCFAGAQDLICGLEESEEHSHTEECHAVTVIKALTCELEENEEHTHGDECYTVVGARRFTCTEAESENHTHGDGCYTELGDDELLCKVEKVEGHTHTDECYTVTEKKDLTCTEEEAEGHTHGDDCYTTTTKEELVCQDESEEHEHTAECYQTTEERELTCEKEEAAGHTHTDECYTVTEEKTLACGQEEVATVEPEHVHTLACSAMVQREVPEAEAADNADTGNAESDENTESTENTENTENVEAAEKHVHTEECYALMPVCGYEEHVHTDLCHEEPKCGIEAHTHRPDCYDEEGNLVCTTEEHKHVENCYKDPHCGINAHLHTEDCYDEEGNLVCGLEEHVHGEECYFEVPTYYCLDRMHVHGDECRDEEENIICGYADFVVHTHDEACYDPNMRLICPLPEIEAHTHMEECYVQESEEEEPKLVCGKEEIVLHTHSEECFDEEGNLICGQTEILVHQHNEECYVELDAAEEDIVKTFEGEEFTVTAVYGSDANLPEEAELLAELITAEDNEEHYAQREAQYREAMGNEEATMRALLKIGFYVDGEEVEPEAPVTITVQFLDENGLEEGSPITVVHFGEDTEVLEGSDAEGDKTSFETEKFSEFGIGYGKAGETITIKLSESIEYQDELFMINFHIEGKVTLPTEEEKKALRSDKVEEGKNAENNEGDVAGQENLTSSTEGQEATETTDSELNGAEADKEEPGEDKLEFKVEVIDQESEKYAKAVADYMDETGVTDELLLLQAFSYYVIYDGIKLDLSNCVVRAEIVPTKELMEAANDMGVPATLDLNEQGDRLADEISPELVITAASEQADGGLALYSATVRDEGTVYAEFEQGSEDEQENENKQANEEGNIYVALTSQANPHFIVQYWANIYQVSNDPAKKIETGIKASDSSQQYNELPLIDTSGSILPENKVTPSIKNIYVYADKTQKGTNNVIEAFPNAELKGKIQSDMVLQEMYRAREYEYIMAPSLKYFDTLIENGNYKLSGIWVHNHTPDCYRGDEVICEESKSDTDSQEGRWIKYEGEDILANLHFTNRSVTAEGNENYVLINSGTIIRLVHEVTEVPEKFNVYFYDYDLGNGYVYKEKPTYTEVNGELTVNGTARPTSDAHDNKLWYIATREQGINSRSNYAESGANISKFAFGNANTATGLEDITWNGDNTLNKANRNGTFKFCTFGLVTGLQNGKLVYANGVSAPNLFNDGDATGKTEYGLEEGTDKTKYSLEFYRQGDTYTLEAVYKGGSIVESAKNLSTFVNPVCGSTKHTHIWTNNFWPMDSAESYDANGHDMKFGKLDLKANRKYAGTSSNSFPESDDGLDHNSYFGMHYEVGFELVNDYSGPLNYYFFGDDDMWVFLSKKNADGTWSDGTLVCDIGGVHSSVGEYVNLWDWINNDKFSSVDNETGNRIIEGSYKLSFFYTERGESGSTCWMQFTLPSVTTLTPKQNTGELRIEKAVTGVATDEEFGFEITFSNPASSDQDKGLKDDYSYTKRKKDGTFVANDLLIWNGAKFTLMADEYIEISYLPDGTEYTIKEIGPVIAEKDDTGRLMYEADGITPKWEIKPVNPYVPDITGDGSEVIVGQVTGTISISKSKMYKVYYNNVQQFALPETGGTGTTLYTIAGVIVLLGGAGFLYRKKFRERRV